MGERKRAKTSGESRRRKGVRRMTLSAVAPNMEAGSSYLQTTDPRDDVEKIAMDGLEERRTGRGSDGLVQADETSKDETSRKGKGKGTGGKGEHDCK